MSSINEWYKEGRVSVLNGGTKVTGINTEWLKEGIKQGDVFLLMGNICEISDVTKNTELNLVKPYSGESVEASAYNIIPLGKSTLTADLAQKIQELIDEWPKYENIISMIEAKADKTEIEPITEYVKSIKKAGIRVDANKNIYQVEPEAEPITDDDIATDDEIDSLIDDVYNN